MTAAHGHCNEMGTASTLAARGRGARHVAAGHGGDPGGRRAPRRGRRADRARARSQLAREELRPARDPDRGRVRQRDHRADGVGGSTNVVDPPARARRAASASTCRSSASTRSRAARPVLANLRPVGRAPVRGSVPRRAASRPSCASSRRCSHVDALTVTGETLGEASRDARCRPTATCIAPLAAAPPARRASSCSRATSRRGRGDQASAAVAGLLRHRGRAVVFEDMDDLTGGSTTPTCRRRPTRCWCSRTPARAAARACPSGGCCRSRRSCSRRACATWCASPTRA